MTRSGFAPGQIVAERFRLLALIGQGGMGSVWRARDLGSGVDIALKLIRAAENEQASIVARFAREAETLTQIRHPNIVGVLDHGIHLGVPYLAMELLEGASLASRLRIGRLPARDVALIVSHVAAGLTAAHDVGITHRDLKPDNIFLVPSAAGPVAKLLDFGIAKRHDPLAKGETLTQTGAILGTPNYMSPEHINGGRAVGARSDLWSLGVIACECMTGVQPFRGDNFLNLLVAICADPIPLPSTLAPVPPGFDEWFLQACDREPAQRFQSASAMAAALTSLVDAAPPDPRWTTPTADDPAIAGVASRDPAARFTHSLPVEATDFIGRDAEIEHVTALLGRHRVVTLCGPGGVGKSRLAVRVAAAGAAGFRDGAHFVPLAAVRDPALVTSTIAGVLGIVEAGNEPLLTTLARELEGRDVLLLLDNLEHLTAATAELALLLERAQGLKLLLTSRVAGLLPDEVAFHVPPLPLPSMDGPTDALLDNDAVALFASRAVRANPEAVFDAADLRAIAELVVQLDGLPLAIELAAARTRLYAPTALVRQLRSDRHRLADSTGDVARRHRAMRDVISWSHDLLDDADRALFRRISTFAGSFSIPFADRVAAAPPVLDIAAGLWSLADKSLLVHEHRGGEDRWHMLESIREFAAEQLERCDEDRAVRAHHLEAFAHFAEECEPHLRRPDSGEALRSLAREDSNLRAALGFALSHDANAGLSMASRLWRYWQAAGRLQEGRRWLVELLARPDVAIASRAQGLAALADLAYWQADYDTAIARYNDALALFRELGDRAQTADTLLAIGQSAIWSGDTDTGERLAREALDMFEAIDAHEQVGMATMAVGFARWMDGDLAAARPLWETSIAIAREVGDDIEAAHKELALASITFQEGRVDQAIADSLAAMNELHAHDNVALTVMAIDWIAALTAGRAPDTAVRLAGAATALRAGLGGGMRPVACRLPDARAVAEELIGKSAAADAFASGRALSLADAVALARLVCSPAIA